VSGGSINAPPDLFQAECRTFIRLCQMLGFALHLEKPNSEPYLLGHKIPAVYFAGDGFTHLLHDRLFVFGEFETGGKFSCVGPACLKPLSESLLRIDLRLCNPQ
jgi:hypothetical protein